MNSTYLRDSITISVDLYRGFIFVLGFLIVFRSQVAYSRWWEGGTLVQQLRGEWFNAFSSLLAFSSSAPEMKDEVLKFQHRLARLMSLLYANALEQLSPDGSPLELIDLEGFDKESLVFMQNSHDPVEITLQWVQRLIVEANTQDIIKIAPPILSRVYNQLGNGIVRLNNVRKIHDYPIPFPITQLISIMLVANWIITSLVCATETINPIMAAVFAFGVQLSFWSINSIAAELEHPFGYDANDLPVLYMQVDLNKSLCSLLQPRATTSPSFDFQKEIHEKLTKSMMGEALPKRRKDEDAASRYDRFTADVDVASHEVASIVHRLEQGVKSAVAPLARLVTPLAAGHDENYRCTDGRADSGDAVEGNATDKYYVDNQVTGADRGDAVEGNATDKYYVDNQVAARPNIALSEADDVARNMDSQQALDPGSGQRAVEVTLMSMQPPHNQGPATGVDVASQARHDVLVPVSLGSDHGLVEDSGAKEPSRSPVEPQRGGLTHAGNEIVQEAACLSNCERTML
jgi:predicted membrane chloride channel (bestrophin family)